MRAPAKINVCLLLGPTRPEDGRHDLVTVFQPVDLADDVVLEEAGAGDAVECPGVTGPNLALAAVAAFRDRTGWDGPPVRVRITKRIPLAGGMAGGSADAAAVLRALGDRTGVGDDVLREIAAGLGADVPSQVRPGRWLATGAGERLAPVAPVAPYPVVLVPSAVGLSTPEVFREADRLGLPRDAAGLAAGLEEVRAALPDLPSRLVVNELQPAALSLRPELGATLDRLRSHGAEVALVSGSGPTCVGLFADPAAAAEAARALDGLAVRTCAA